MMTDAEKKQFTDMIAYELQVEMDQKILDMLERDLIEHPPGCIKIEYEYPIDPLDNETLEQASWRYVHAFRITREVCDCEDIFR